MFDAFLRTHDLDALLLPPERRRAFPTIEERSSWEALPDGVKAQLLDWGREALKGYPAVTATQFLAFARQGNRQCYEAPYFRRRTLLMGAVLALGVAPEDARFLDAVVDGLWCILEESTWILSAHNDPTGAAPPGTHPLPDPEHPIIDLFAAQTAATVATVAVMAGERLDAVSPVIRQRVTAEVNRRIFVPFMDRNDMWWMGFTPRPLNNWTPWILSNIMDAMLLLGTDAQLKAAYPRAMAMLDRYLADQPQDGGCDEGVAYWNMAGGSLLDFLESLRTATGGQADFYQDPLIRAIGDFPVKAHIDGPWFWNFADCDAQPLLDGERLYRYGLRTDNAALMALGSAIHARRKAVRPQDTPQMNRVLFSLFQPPPEIERDVQPMAVQPSAVALPRLQVFGWRGAHLYAAVKGGHNDESHNHNDVGSFILYADGEPHVVDAGNMVYTAKTFGPERYTLWNTRGCYHNLPLIGGVEQQAGRCYEAQDVQADDQGVSMSLAAAYPQEAGVAVFRRTLRMTAGYLRLTDVLTLNVLRDVVWIFLLRQRPTAEDGFLRFGRLRLRLPDRLRLHVEELPVEDARMARSFPGSLWRVMLSAPASTAHQMTFLFEYHQGS